MLIKQNDYICLTCEENGQGLLLIDQRRKTRWALDPQSLVYGKAVQNPWGNLDPEPQPLVPLYARYGDDSTIVVTYQAGTSGLEMCFRIMEEFVEVSLSGVTDDQVGHVSLPGSFIPHNEPLSLLLPIMQGMLWDGRGRR